MRVRGPSIRMKSLIINRSVRSVRSVDKLIERAVRTTEQEKIMHEIENGRDNIIL